MSISSSARIHPTAIVDPQADIGDHVEIGPYAIIEGPVTIGAHCVIRPHACLVGPITMGERNQVYSGAVLGERPQHLKYNDEPTSVVIGNGNVFREHVTVHRGTTQAMKTVIGDGNFLMSNSHIAHDCQIGNRCILASGALLAGHVILEDNVFLSGNSAVGQFARVGRLAFLSGCSASTKDIPPFMMNQHIDTTAGVNVIGMRRAGMTHAQIDAVRASYKILFRSGMVLPAAIARLERDLGDVDAVQELITFLRGSKKGVNSTRTRLGAEAA